MNSDEELDRAVASLRDMETGEPAPHLQADTLAALRRAGQHARGGFLHRTRGADLTWKLAAAVAIAACGFAIYMLLAPQQSHQIVDHSPSQAGNTEPPDIPVPSTQRVAPEPTVPAPPNGNESKLVENPPPRPQSPPDGAVVTASAARWSIAGTVSFRGDVPPPSTIDLSAAPDCARHHPAGALDESFVVRHGRLANVVVSVRPTRGQELPAGPAPARPAMLDQKGCRYQPHVLAMRVGQPIVVSNSDPLLHNVRALTLDNPAFNFGQPTIDPGRNLGPMKAAEVFKVKCDFHPWMLAYVHVFDHPYFAVTDEDGAYSIPAGLPDGKYTLVAWHEKLGEREIAVEVKGGKAEGANFEFAAK